MELKLYEWQEEAIKMSHNLPSMALFAEMGTGKSCAAIQILRARMNEAKKFYRTLILGPVAVVYNWQEELQKFSKIPLERIFVSTGTGKKRADDLGKFLESGGKIAITNYESLRNKALFGVIKEWQPEVIIFDESHMLKSYQSKQSKLSYELSKKAKFKYLLTGTPILNTAMDIFMQYKILDNGETFGQNFFTFRNNYFFDANQGWKGKNNYYPDWKPRKELFGDLSDKIYRKAIRVLKKDCLDLPPRIEKVHHVGLSNEQARLYKEMKRDFITFIKDNADKPRAVVAELALTKALRLQQICTGYAPDDEGKVIDLGMVPRLKETKQLLQQLTPNHKVILWCSFRHNYRQLRRVCEEIGIGYVFITGEQTAKQKQESIVQFRSDDSVRVVIANRKAAGTGINLVEASYSIVYSRNFSLAEENQSRDRNHRGGSEIHERVVKIDLCARDTIDEVVLKSLRQKQKMSDIIVDLADIL